jgi:hypothetical protein
MRIGSPGELGRGMFAECRSVNCVLKKMERVLFVGATESMLM